jgi:hypothetical protein
MHDKRSDVFLQRPATTLDFDRACIDVDEEFRPTG